MALNGLRQQGQALGLVKRWKEDPAGADREVPWHSMRTCADRGRPSRALPAAVCGARRPDRQVSWGSDGCDTRSMMVRERPSRVAGIERTTNGKKECPGDLPVRRTPLRASMADGTNQVTNFDLVDHMKWLLRKDGRFNEILAVERKASCLHFKHNESSLRNLLHAVLMDRADAASGGTGAASST